MRGSNDIVIVGFIPSKHVNGYIYIYIYIYINQRSILSNNPDLAIAIVELGETSYALIRSIVDLRETSYLLIESIVELRETS